MWFCDLRQMPRLRDCVYEATSNILKWLCDLFGARGDRRPPGAPARGRGRGDV
jgi:hypothetical protein